MGMNERIYYSNEAARRAMAQRTVLALIAAVLGIVFGALLALAFAPQAGDKTRRQLGDEVQKVAGGGLENVGKAASSVIDRVGKVAHQVRETVEDKFNNH
jgi:gas vesicle protein